MLKGVREMNRKEGEGIIYLVFYFVENRVGKRLYFITERKGLVWIDDNDLEIIRRNVLSSLSVQYNTKGCYVIITGVERFSNK